MVRAIGGKQRILLYLDTTLDPLRATARYVHTATDNLCRRGELFRPRTPHGQTKMTTIRGSARYAGLLPVEPSDKPSPIHPTTLENEWFPNRQPSRHKRRPPAIPRLLIALCAGAAATLAWWSYGEAARQIIASAYPQLAWLAPRGAISAQKTPDTAALTASAAHFSDQQGLDEVLRDVHAIRQSIDRLAASQEQITRSIDLIATSVSAGQELTHSADETASSTALAPASDATRIAVESRADGESLQPTQRFDIKPTEARPPQTVSQRDKQLPAASRHDVSCFQSASAVLQNYPGGRPSWTLRAPGHEGTPCWYAAGRPGASDHRSETTPRRETVGTTPNRLSPPPYPLPPE